MIAGRLRPKWRPSPNFGERRNGQAPSIIVIHYTAMESAAAALDRLCAPEHEVSCHYLIAEDGALFQLVDEDMRAWHAGQGSWCGACDVNSRSIGIELDNLGRSPFPAAQMLMLERLLGDVMGRRSIPAKRVLGHSDLAVGRKADPGWRFDWRRLALGGMSVWPDSAQEAPPDEEGFLKAAEAFGYPVADGSGKQFSIDQVVSAFRLRFRPWESGPLNARDMADACDLASRFPCGGCRQNSVIAEAG